jgi:hypothetical protein
VIDTNLFAGGREPQQFSRTIFSGSYFSKEKKEYKTTSLKSHYQKKMKIKEKTTTRLGLAC